MGRLKKKWTNIMEVEKYIKLVENNKDDLDNLIITLKANVASEAEATFALMKGLDMKLDDAREKIRASLVFQ